MEGIARKYLKLTEGRCKFEARNVCSAADEKAKDLARYSGQFRRCLLDEFCPEQAAVLTACIERNRNKSDRKGLQEKCASETAVVDACMKWPLAGINEL